MKTRIFTTVTAMLLAPAALLADGGEISLIDQNSPDFPLGKQTHINMKFIPKDHPDMWFKAGIRLQGTLESKRTDRAGESTTTQDAYLRRVRLEIGAGFGPHTSFTMDIRNDKSNYGIENDEGQFSVGDAYLKIKKPFDSSLVNFKLYRAKIDVSRTETVKSAFVIDYDRPYVADAAAQYISLNRRGANIQMYGHWHHKIHYQVAFGSASSPEKIIDAAGIKASDASLSDQSFFYGGKIRLSPIDGWEEKRRTETYLGVGQHISVGIGYWAVPTLKGTVAAEDGSAPFNLNRRLLNLEFSAHYEGAFLQAEYFRFEDMVKSWDPTATGGSIEVGTSSGWYVTGEYVFEDLYYLAPFFRYESWDRFDDESGYDVTSTVLGINWYLRGNTTKVGFNYQKDEFGKAAGDKTVEYFRLTSQWFF